jgi:short-subunit dehydrogenase
MKRTTPYRFEGRTALITGAASGIGRELAIALAARGAHLALLDRNEPGLAETVALAMRSDLTISRTAIDLADARAIDELPARIAALHPKIDILINNAGVALGGSFEQVDASDFDWLMAINFGAVVRMTRAFLPMLRRSDDALLVNVSSIFGIIAPAGQTAYAASKFAVRGFSQSLRAELAGSTVGVSVVHPGGVATAIAASARIPKDAPPDEVARNQRLWQKMLRLPASDAAAIILRGLERRRARILVGTDAAIAALAERLAPVSYGALLRMLAPK